MLLVVGSYLPRVGIVLPAVIGDHMVLQRDGAVVWGWADPGRTITVALATVSAASPVGDDGRWSVKLDGLSSGGPHTMMISGDGERTVRDVLIGDVWLGAGQSNMLLPVRQADGAESAATPADCARIRLFTVERVAADGPLRDVRGRWRVCTPESVAEFSAVAWYFGRDVAARQGVPVGLVVGAWGDTAIDAWMPDPTGGAPRPRTPHDDTFDLRVADLRLVPGNPAAAATPVALAPGDAGRGGPWRAFAAGGSRASWDQMSADPPVARCAGKLADAGAWARCATALGGSADLSDFAAIAFRARGRGTFRLILGQKTITDGDDHGASFVAGPDWTPVEVPLDSLRQEGWGAARLFARDAITSLGFAIAAPAPRAPGSAWNGMLAPLAPMRLRGVLWYQGEADVLRASSYAASLLRLVRAWRDAFGADDLPFLVVQLPAYAPPAVPPDAAWWAELREAQRAVLTLPATALVTTIDVGDAHDIHPKRKIDVGRRLARAAERIAYGRATVATGPSLSEVELRESGCLRLHFVDVDRALTTRDDAPPTGFTLSADGRRFHPASARLVDDTTLDVWSDAVPQPVEVRYAWADDPGCNLVDRAGLPAAPFRVRLFSANSRDGAAAARGSDPPPAPPAH